MEWGFAADGKSMAKIAAAAISLLLLIASPRPGRPEGLPPVAACEAIMLRMSQGWWLRVNADGSGVYGFGALTDRIEVREGSYCFTEIYERAKTAAAGRVNAEAPSVAVSCLAAGQGSAREFYLTDEAPIVDLLRTARKNRTKPRNEEEERQHKKIDAFWKRSSFNVVPPRPALR